MSTAIKENISENEVSPIGDKSGRRGRPALMNAATEAAYVALGLFASSAPARSKANVHYRQRAMSVLGDNFKWLFDAEKIMVEGGGEHWKPTILIELGRIEDEGAMKAVATQLCELKPNTRDAVLMVRRLRTGGLPDSDALQLTNEIISTINRYLRGHSKVTKGDIQSALRTAWASVDESGIDEETEAA